MLVALNEIKYINKKKIYYMATKNSHEWLRLFD